MIVPGPWFPEAVELLAQNPGLDVGVHLCLTSEWQGLKWRSLTQAPGLVDADGYFFPMVFPEKGLPRHTSLKEADPRTEDVERELRRQIEVARRHIPHLSYLSSHMGFPALNLSLIHIYLTKHKVIVAQDVEDAVKAGAAELLVRDGAIFTPSAQDLSLIHI